MLGRSHELAAPLLVGRGAGGALVGGPGGAGGRLVGGRGADVAGRVLLGQHLLGLQRALPAVPLRLRHQTHRLQGVARAGAGGEAAAARAREVDDLVRGGVGVQREDGLSGVEAGPGPGDVVVAAGPDVAEAAARGPHAAAVRLAQLRLGAGAGLVRAGGGPRVPALPAPEPDLLVLARPRHRGLHLVHRLPEGVPPLPAAEVGGRGRGAELAARPVNVDVLGDVLVLVAAPRLGLQAAGPGLALRAAVADVGVVQVGVRGCGRRPGPAPVRGAEARGEGGREGEVAAAGARHRVLVVAPRRARVRGPAARPGRALLRHHRHRARGLEGGPQQVLLAVAEDLPRVVVQDLRVPDGRHVVPGAGPLHGAAVRVRVLAAAADLPRHQLGHLLVQELRALVALLPGPLPRVAAAPAAVDLAPGLGRHLDVDVGVVVVEAGPVPLRLGRRLAEAGGGPQVLPGAGLLLVRGLSGKVDNLVRFLF